MIETEKNFIFEGNDVCLDFINTEIIDRGKRIDLLGDYGEFVSWLAVAGCIDPGTYERMLGQSEYDREEILGEIKSFRTKLRDMALAISAGKPVRLSHIEPINKILRKDTRYSNLILINAKARLITHSSYNTFDPHLPIAQAAAELLTLKDLSLVRKCTNPDCSLFFYDQSKNHARRWCSMERCGNRMKAALHYKRGKDGRPMVSV
jgi:predicted RNA-binding Zn ribbon-like protein